jgi:acyl-CoA dehydrogenase
VFIVPADTPGWRSPSGWKPSRRIRWRGSLQRMCRIPATAMIGKPGAGFKVAMSVLDVFRSTVGRGRTRLCPPGAG